MSTRLERQAPLLKLLQKATPKVRKSMLKNYCQNPDFVNCLCDCAKNVLKGNVRVSPAQLKVLRRGKLVLRQLALKKTSAKKKKKIIQSGGFLPLLGAIIPGVISLITGLINRN